MLKIKLIGMTALCYKTIDGKTKRVTSKQCPDLFKKLNAILKEAEKKGAFFLSLSIIKYHQCTQQAFQEFYLHRELQLRGWVE